MNSAIKNFDQAGAAGQRLLCYATLFKMEADTSPTALRRLLGIFRNELLKRSGIVRDSRNRQDVSSLGVCVHAMKSSALSFGCVPLAEKCVQVEDFCQQGLDARAFDHCDPLLVLIHNTLEALDVFESETR